MCRAREREAVPSSGRATRGIWATHHQSPTPFANHRIGRSTTLLGTHARPKVSGRTLRPAAVQGFSSGWVMNTSAAVQATTMAESQWMTAIGSRRCMVSTPTP